MRASILLVGAIALTVVACTTEDNTSRLWREGTQRTSAAAGTEGDPCAPGNAKLAADEPFAACALKTEQHVQDLTLPAGQRKSTTTTQSLRVMDAPAPAAAGTCGGKTGPGFTSCGPNGDDSCCRAATVPAGVAGATVTIATPFDLGIYTVTEARLHQFVDALGGNIRGAAAAGQLQGYAAANASNLPDSRDAVDNELGAACQFRADPSNYGARSWWSQDVEDTVASFMTDDNDRAADIRKDATASRLAAKPGTCVSYWMASAFCAWDGGRLPSNDEWVYAALGGDELRVYPWGADRTRDRLVTDFSRAQQTGEGDSDFTYPEDFPDFDNGMNSYHIAPPGRKPAGAGRWGHLDLAGNVLQWTADIVNGAGIVRGGSWEGHADANADAFTNYALTRTYGSLGFRCAYGAAQPVVVPPPPAPAVTKVPVYRSYAAVGDHLLSLTSGEGAPTFKLEGVAFQALAGDIDAATTATLYRCFTAGNGHHYVSTQQDCEGAGANEGLLGGSYRAQHDGTVPVYRCYQAQSGDHVTTVTPNECVAAGMTVEGSQGFVFPAP